MTTEHYINRAITSDIIQKLAAKQSKIIVIYGSRQVGKTTLVKTIIQHTNYRVLYLNGDDRHDIEKIKTRDTIQLTQLVAGYELLFIDEAQKISDIGINLKILYDNCRSLKLIVTGSSALELANTVAESLAGRTHTYYLYPLSFLELSTQFETAYLKRSIDTYLIYGSYPDVLQYSAQADKKAYLQDLSESYLYKDVLEIGSIRYSRKLKALLTLLAFQIGSEVSYSEIGQQVGLSHHTVIDYIQLLTQAFIIKPLYGFSRNLRKEITKKPKLYFHDLGIRNALIGNFAPLNMRSDSGALWENFLVMERTKRNHYQKHYCNAYFWRTYTGAELDYIEDYDGTLHGYEFKWRKSSKIPERWRDNYSQSFQCINSHNFLEFIL